MDGPIEERPQAQWRTLNPRLWVGYRGTRTLGTIERGWRRYTWLDHDGMPHGDYASLQDAQAAAAVDPPCAAPKAAARWVAVAVSGLLLVLAVVGTAWALHALAS